MPAVTRFNANYCDEYDVHGISVWDTLPQALESIKNSWINLSDSEYGVGKGFWVGGSDFLEFESRAHFESCWEVEEISEVEKSAFNKVVKSNHFGTLP